MKLQYICKECNGPFNSPKALGAHVAIKHDAHEYYDKYCKKDGDGVCVIMLMISYINISRTS